MTGPAPAHLPVTADGASDAGIVALLWVDRSARAWNVTIATLLQNPKIRHIHVGFAQGQSDSAIVKRDPRITLHGDVGLLEFSERALESTDPLVLFCTWPGKPSIETFDLAVEQMELDPRIGTVSFLSNAAGAFSFPHRNTGTPFTVEGHDEVSLTQILRKRKTADEGLTSVHLPDGAMVLVSRSMWDVCGQLDDYGTTNLALALVDLSMRGRKRGFNNYLDTSSYVTMPWDDVGAFHSILLNPDARHALNQRYPYFPMGYDVECARPTSVLAEALDSARARAMGLRILIDGSALGPKEMGTQVLTLKLSLALADRDEVQTVIVAVPDPATIPAYAKDLARHKKIRVIASDNLNFPDAPHVDIIHRPYQPSSPIPWDRWRSISKRSLITVQDLIAYRNPAYFDDCTAWLGYRDNFMRQIVQADGVVSISRDVANVIHEERLPIDPSRVYVVENGVNARSKGEASRIPDAILERGWASSPFLFVLGANYAHKNRDLAMRVWAQLRAKGYPHKLVMAGASVPAGSVRIEESLLGGPQLDPHLMVLPDISSEERNWLIKNSSLMVYLTSAEGFGLVPFEAACLDVPTLFVSFGPLRELTNDPDLPRNYGLDGLVERARDLLDSPAAARAAVSGALKNMSNLTWGETVRKSIDCYFSILAQPPRVLSI